MPSSNNHGTNRFARASFEGKNAGGNLLLTLPNAGGVDKEGNPKGVTLPCVQFTMSNGVNAIPTAAALVPLGRNARTKELSTAYTVIQELKQMARVRITLTGNIGDYSPNGAAGGTGEREQWPMGEHLLFMGYIAGTSYRRSQGSVSLVVNFVHKLFDLASSSAGSADLVPGAPNSLVFPAFATSAGGNKAGNGGNLFTEDLNADIGEDFSTGIIKVLKEVCNRQLQTHNAVAGEDGVFCDGTPPDRRKKAGLNKPSTNLRALGVLDAEGDWQGTTNAGTKYPLDAAKSQHAHAINQIGNTVFQSLAGTTLWSMLIGGLLPQFGMGVVPLADEAYIVPLTPALTSSVAKCKTIYPREYVDFAMTTMSTRPLYGVGIVTKFTNATLPSGAGDGKVCCGASYTAKLEDGDPAAYGQWLFRSPPKWCEDWVSTDPETENPKDIEKMLNEPSTDGVGGAAEAFNRDVDGEVEAWNDSLRQFAQQIYVANALRDRSGRITGKLRFDICPGSTIIINAKDAVGSQGGADVLPISLVGFVSRVVTSINAETASATTTFELTHLRTSEEDLKGERFSLKSPPFFEEGFYGAPLVRTLDVNPVGE
tara:strand:+ start:1118 stop:2905 length:1788 start_codon:yes stop_codon:yes gene_type:complete